MMEPLQATIDDLHGTVKIELDVRKVSSGYVIWEAKWSGENFLDGEWVQESGTQVSKNWKQFMRKDLPKVLKGEK
jgi:hypothetical protein